MQATDTCHSQVPPSVGNDKRRHIGVACCLKLDYVTTSKEVFSCGAHSAYAVSSYITSKIQARNA